MNLLLWLLVRVERSTFINSDQLLVEHLIRAFLAGELDTTSRLLTLLYSKINMSLRYRAIEFIGRILNSDSDQLSVEVIERAKKFWVFRLEKCIGVSKESLNDTHHELMAFKYWVSMQALDEKWVLNQLQTLLTYSQVFTLNRDLIDRLVKSIESQPVEVSEILDRMVNICGSTEDQWGWDTSIKALFQDLLNTKVRDKARAIIHKLGAFGHTQYSDLLAMD